MRKIISTNKAPIAIGPYSQGKIVGNLVFVSGQLPINPIDGEMPNTIEEQTRQSLKNVMEILKEANCTSKDIVKTTIFTTNMDNFSKINEIYAEFFDGEYPCRSAVEVSKLPKNALIEIEAIAVK
ncbi:RidA family protein [Defluviitalea phaphyphila]|uniref:RidA family protein n=1 Tax=Defluviitalea phaphyphila TaxID=1473580 RepID=UPI0007319539|nr:RidA family protein [Defluviitalea phaphyphila]